MDALSSPFGESRPARGAGPYSAATRLVTFALGALVALLGVYEATKWSLDAYPITATAWAVSTAPLAALFLAIALAPAWTDRQLGRFSRARLADGGHVFALVVLAITLFLVFGFSSLVAGGNSVEDVLLKGHAPAGEAALDEASILAELSLNLFIFVVPPAIWLSFVQDVPLGGIAAALGFRRENAPMAIAVGAVSALAAVVVIVAATIAATQGGVNVPPNDRAVEIARSLSIPAAIAVAVVSGLTEEVFFRGFLMPRVGVFAQAVLFSLAHLTYLNVLESLVTFALALAFAALYRFTKNLWAPVSAHFAFNLIMLLAGRFAPT